MHAKPGEEGGGGSRRNMVFGERERWGGSESHREYCSTCHARQTPLEKRVRGPMDLAAALEIRRETVQFPSIRSAQEAYYRIWRAEGFDVALHSRGSQAKGSRLQMRATGPTDVRNLGF